MWFVRTHENESSISHSIPALLDLGSECCFTTEWVTQRMKILRRKIKLSIAEIDEAASEVRYKLQFPLKSRISHYVTAIEAFALPKISVDLPSATIDASCWSLPTVIQLADPYFYQYATDPLILFWKATMFPTSSVLLVVFNWTTTCKFCLRRDDARQNMSRTIKDACNLQRCYYFRNSTQYRAVLDHWGGFRTCPISNRSLMREFLCQHYYSLWRCALHGTHTVREWSSGEGGK